MPLVTENPNQNGLDLVFLDPSAVHLFPGPGDSVRMTIEGWNQSYLYVKIRRAFPLTEPDHYIGFNDGEDKDIGLVINPKELDKPSQKLIKQELIRRYFIPTIQSISSLKHEYGMSYWSVETNKGRKEFVSRGRRESLHEVSPNRYIVTDVDDNRYDIFDVDLLDKRSYRLLCTILY